MQIHSFFQQAHDYHVVSLGALALPESSDERVLRSAEVVLRQNMVTELYLWQGSLTQSWAETIPAGLRGKIVWVDSQDPKLRERTSTIIALQAHKKGKNLATDSLQLRSSDPLYQAGALLEERTVSACLAGAIHTTADVIRAALATVGTIPGCQSISGAFILEAPQNWSHLLQPAPGPLLFADCGVIVEPSDQQLMDIAQGSLRTWQSLLEKDHGPARVAFLSFSTKGSAVHPRAQRMSQLSQTFAQLHPDIACDGELQLDAAISPEVAARKCPDSPLKGQARCFIFEDLAVANCAYKITQRLAGYKAYGPLLQGLAKPYNDLSRGASVDDIVVSSYLSLLMSQHEVQHV